jgi:hypothetical protein
MKTYKVSDLLGKNLILNREVPVYRYVDGAKPIYMARAGQSAGTIDSWVTSKKTGNVWLLFYNSQKVPYYINTKDLANAVNRVELKREGVKTTAEIEKEQEKKSAPIEYYLKKYAPWIGGGVLALVLINRALK